MQKYHIVNSFNQITLTQWIIVFLITFILTTVIGGMIALCFYPIMVV